MKLTKGLLFLVSLSMLATSCGGDTPSSGGNPFDPNTKLTKEAAQRLINTWINELDTSAYFLANVNYSVDEKTPGSTGLKYYQANYLGQYDSDNRYFMFLYSEGSLMPEKSNVGVQEVEASLMIGNGLAYINDTFDSRYNYSYYYDGNNFSLYDYEEFAGEGKGYIILTMDKRGLISYQEMYEADSQYHSKEIISATFSEMH